MNDTLERPEQAGKDVTPGKVEPIKTQIAEYSPTAAAIASLTEKYKGVLFTVTTKTGLAEAKEARKELRGLRIALEAKRTELKAPALERARLIDDEAKRVTAAIVAIEDPIAAQIQLEEVRLANIKAEAEAKEKARIESLRGRISHYRTIAGALLGKPSSEVQFHLDDVTQNPVGDEFEEFKGEATDARTICISQLETLLRDRKQFEIDQEQIAKDRADLASMRAEEDARRVAEQAEAERKAAIQRAAQEAIDKQQREARATELAAIEAEIAKKRAEQAKLDQEAAERRKIEQARIDAEQKAVQDKIDAENRAQMERIEAEKRELAAAAAKQTAELKAKQEAEAQADLRQRNAAASMVAALQLILELAPVGSQIAEICKDTLALTQSA